MQKLNSLLVAGTFDFFHMGHQFLLWKAITKCHQLTIIIARDQTVQKVKGKLPYHNEDQRLQKVAKENFPNAQIQLGREDGNHFKTLEMLSPEGIFLGYDQKFDERRAQYLFPELEIVRAEPYHPQFFKSSRFRG